MSVLLPTGTVTLLWAGVEGSTRRWETRPDDDLTAVVAGLNRVVSDIIAAHHGVRPVVQDEGDGFVAAFARASDAVACALELQRTPLAPMRLRIGVHTGEMRPRDQDNDAGPTIERAARLRDLAHGGQTILSATTTELVADLLPEGAWLTDLGSPQGGLPRPERVVQLCHPELVNEFPPLQVSSTVVGAGLPVQLTSFVGRHVEMHQVRRLLAEHRLVTLTGAGGVGKTRLAVRIATRIAGEFGEGVWFVDLAPIADPSLVPVTVARALGLPDHPGLSTMDTLLRCVRDRQMLLVLDNCEHLLDASAALVVAVLGGAVGLTVLATSREPIGATGEVAWRVPSLSLRDEAIELFADRARLARPDFTFSDDTAVAVGQICARLDGMPLAIELAAARVRALSPAEILEGLHDRFRLLTGGARTAARRQQTLGASVDWSHTLLSEPERVVFRRVAVFLGGFDLNAAQVVAGGDAMQRFQVLDLLTLLVDKSLVVAESSSGRTRYRLLETVHQYALEKLGESGEAEAVRSRHRDHYTATAAQLDAPAGTDYEQHVEAAETEIDNLRTAFGWSRQRSDIEQALAVASSLQPLWLARGRVREGLAWFDAVLTDDSQQAGVARVVLARALADRAVLAALMGAADSPDQAQHALAMARGIDDPALLARALTACGYTALAQKAEVAAPYFAEAIGLARAVGDRWRLSQILGWQARGAIASGDPIVARAAGQEGLDLAEAIGDRFVSRQCRFCLGMAQWWQGDLAGAAAQFAELVADAEAAHDPTYQAQGLAGQGMTLAWMGQVSAARAAADTAVEAAAQLGGLAAGIAYWASAIAALAAGDAGVLHATATAGQYMSVLPAAAANQHAMVAQAALAVGDLIAARRRADDAITTATGWFLMWALTTRARVAIAQGEPHRAERDAFDALACAADIGAHLLISDTLECLATVAAAAGSHRRAARLFGAADDIRQRIGAVRFQVYDAGYHVSVAALRNAMGGEGFDSAWAEGAAMSTEEVIGYAQRGRSQRKHPTSGWESLTPTERDVVRLVREGLVNNDIATRLFISPRTVQTHLTHVYSKLGLTSRVALVQEAARHTDTRGRPDTGG